MENFIPEIVSIHPLSQKCTFEMKRFCLVYPVTASEVVMFLFLTNLKYFRNNRNKKLPVVTAKVVGIAELCGRSSTIPRFDDLSRPSLKVQDVEKTGSTWIRILLP